jgi:hypothetical protein
LKRPSPRPRPAQLPATPILAGNQSLPGLRLWIVATVLALASAIFAAALILVPGASNLLSRWNSAVEKMLDLLELNALAIDGGMTLIAGAGIVAGCWFLAVLLHECGHLAAGIAVGYECLSFSAAPFSLARTPAGWKLSPYFSGAAEGLVRFRTGNRGTRARWIFTFAAGPSVNLGLWAAAVYLSPPEPHLFVRAFIFWNGLLAVFSVIPFTYSGVVSDGGRLLMLWLSPGRTKRWFALVRLQESCDTSDGIRNFEAALVENATALRDRSADKATAHWLAYWQALLQQRQFDAMRHLEEVLRCSDLVNGPLRELAYLEAAVFSARQLRDPALARSWLARARKQTRRTASAMSHARAAYNIAFAEKDLEGLDHSMELISNELEKLPSSPVSVKLQRRWNRFQGRLRRVLEHRLAQKAGASS